MTGAVASAPGKMLLSGEYAVLHGAPAVVMAVNRYCRVTLTTAAGNIGSVLARPLSVVPWRYQWQDDDLVWLDDVPIGDTRLASLLLNHLHRRQVVDVVVDTSDFFHGETKLGLGSSAAMVVAWLRAASSDSDDSAAMMREALAIHRDFQNGRGSGADIAASTAGGVVAYRMEGASIEPLAWPDGLYWRAIATAQSASTPKMLDRMTAFGARHPGQFEMLMTGLDRVSRQLIAAFAASDVAAIVQAYGHVAEQLLAFAEQADIPIQTDSHREIASIAARHQVQYKTSGAGGGDIGIALADCPDRLEACCRQLHTAGFIALPMGLADRAIAA